MSCSCMAIKIWRIYLEVHPGIYPAWLITMENHHFLWVNPLCLWPFSIAMFVYQRVSFLQPIYIVRVFPVRIYLSCNIVIYALNWDARSSGLVWKCDTANSSPVGYSDSKILPIKMDPSLGQTQLILLAACVYIYIYSILYIYTSQSAIWNSILIALSQLPFFHSQAYVESMSPAILRFALGCHCVTCT